MKRKDEKLIKETQRDILAETEEKLGKRHEEFSEAEQAFALFEFIRENEIKQNRLANAGDTNFRMSWNSFLELILNNGFKMQDAWAYDKEGNIAQMKMFKKPGELIKKGGEPYDILATFTRDGMLIVATSYDDRINGGNIYYERELKEGIRLSDIRSKSSFGMFTDKKFQGSYDIREGLMVHIRELEEKTNAIPIWEVPDPRPWLISYVDEKLISGQKNSYDLYGQLRKERISNAQEALRNMCSTISGDSIILRAGTYSNNEISTIDLSKVKISKIEDGAFIDCPKLEKIIIDSDVRIPSGMIENCPNLKSLIVHGIEIPLNNGKVADNTLTGIDELISQEKTYKDKEYLDDILAIQSRLEVLYKQSVKENKLDLLEALSTIKENINDEDEHIKISVDGVDYIPDFVGNGYKKYSKNEPTERITTEEFIKVIDDIISDSINGKIKEVNLSSNATGRIQWEDEGKQAKMIREDIEKISREITGLTMMKDGLFREDIKQNNDER